MLTHPVRYGGKRLKVADVDKWAYKVALALRPVSADGFGGTSRVNHLYAYRPQRMRVDDVPRRFLLGDAPYAGGGMADADVRRTDRQTDRQPQ